MGHYAQLQPETEMNGDGHFDLLSKHPITEAAIPLSNRKQEHQEVRRPDSYAHVIHERR